MKRILLLAVCICALSVCCIQVSAHPGRTNANGGHMDHSTGEYHYHHGYSAHDHYDMNNDGTKDCPYDFKDRTGQSSGSSSVTAKQKIAETEPVTANQPDLPAKKFNLEDIPMFVGTLGALLIMVAWIGAFFNENIGAGLLHLGFRLLGLFLLLLILLGCYYLVTHIYQIVIMLFS